MLSSLAFTLAFGFAGPALADTIDFGSVAHGEIVTTQIAGVTISAVNPNRSHDLAVGFDTTQSGTSDPDLEAGGGAPYWAGGNLVDEPLGIVLILQENATGCGDGFCDDPDDEGRRPAGGLIFEFDDPLASFGFDIVDVEDVTAEAGRVLFFANGSVVPDAMVEFSDFVTSGSSFYDPSIVFGDRTANRIAEITAADLGLADFDRVIIRMGGSGGVDNVQFTPGTPVPEPTTVALLALGVVGVAGVGRRSAG